MQAELLGHFLLPLLDKASRRDDQASLKVTPDQELLDQKPGHDSLPGPGIVCQQKAKRLPRQHFTVDGRDLVRQRFNLGGADSKIGIEKMGKTDAIGLGRQAEKASVRIEGVCTALTYEFETGLLTDRLTARQLCRRNGRRD